MKDWQLLPEDKHSLVQASNLYSIYFLVCLTTYSRSHDYASTIVVFGIMVLMCFNLLTRCYQDFEPQAFTYLSKLRPRN